MLPVAFVWFIFRCAFRCACCWLHEPGLLHRARKRVSRPPSGPCACVHQQPAVHRLRQQSVRRRLLCAVRTDPSVRRELSAPETHRCLPSPSIAPCVATVLPATLIVAHRARCNGVALPCLALQARQPVGQQRRCAVRRRAVQLHAGRAAFTQCWPAHSCALAGVQHR
jgi:hypothetical protein